MNRSAWIAAGLCVAWVSGVVGYATLDVLDVAPGPFSLKEPPPGAMPPPALASVAPAPGQAADTPAMPGVNNDAAATAVTSLTSAIKAPAKVAVVVTDPLSGEVVAAANEGSPLTPASSLKVLTGLAALHELGPSHRLTTSTTLSGSTVTLVGGGDIHLAPNEGNGKKAEGYAGLGDLARETAAALQKQGVPSVQVALDDTLFPSSDWRHPDWQDESLNYVGPVQALAIAAGRLQPDVAAYDEDSALTAAKTFVTRLQETGITVTGDVRRAPSPAGATALAKVESAPLVDLVSHAMKHSDNTATELECRLLALHQGKSPTFAEAAAAVQTTLKQLGVNTTGLTMRDCSGLSDNNRATVTTLASVIGTSRNAGSEGSGLFPSTLAFGGVDGTLDERYVDAGFVVRAKTGSLSSVASLTGTVITKTGHPLDFSVIVDGFAEGGLMEARLELDTFVQALAAL